MHQALVASCVALYVSRNFARVVGLESPEPLANLYDRSFFRATWITTALDAGWWTAMHLRPKWLRHSAEIMFTLYYLVCAEQADEMVRRVRGDLSVEHLRVSWNKPNTPILRFFTSLMRPKFMKQGRPRPIKIARPQNSDYREPVSAWLYYDGPMEKLKNQHQVVLDIPGGGFVAMDPRCHDDKLMAWAGKLGIPVVALDYKKAPEHPYPHALNECYDAYFQIVATRGRCIGLSGDHAPKIIISGDSAGGNLAFGTVLMILDDQPHYASWESGPTPQRLPPPEAVVGIYPALEMNIGNWMTDEQLSLLRRSDRKKEDKKIMARKSQDYRKLTPETPGNSDDEDDEAVTQRKGRNTAPKMYTRLAMSSMISYFNDRIISPEMLRAMIVLYVGEYRRPDFATDYLLSPLRAPESLLARFPKTFLLCGERDPLVDDTAIFAGRLRQAHAQEFTRRQELGIESEDAVFNDKKHVEVVLVDGVSHGFLQFVSVFPRGWQYVHACSYWMRDVFERAERADAAEPPSSVASNSGQDYFSHSKARSRRTSEASNEERPLEIPSKLRMTSINGATSPTAMRQKGASSRSTSNRRGKTARSSAMSGRKSPGGQVHFLSRLASTEDLLERRMNRVTGNLNNSAGKPNGHAD